VKVEYHLVAGGIASAALIPELGVNSAAFFASVLIDFDHYLDYVGRNKLRDFSVRRMFEYAYVLSEKDREGNFVALSVMHTVEFILFVYLIAALTGLATIEAILWGLLFHMVVDIIFQWSQGKLFHRAFSIVEYVIRWNRLKRRGMRPELPYIYALKQVLPGSEPPEDPGE
jgi:hypothetical protein